MAKIKNVTRSSCNWIEISLHSAAVMSQARPAFIKRNTPVKADHICTSFFHRGKECGGVGPEVNDGDARGFHLANQFRRPRQNVAAVILDRKAAHPTIEDLDCVSSGADLLDRVLRGYSHQLCEEFVPCALARIHQLLCIEVVPRAPAFNHVTRKSKRRTAKSDDG